MDVRAMHFDFKVKMDRVDTLTNPDFNIAEIDWLLNEAQLIFIKQRYGVNNIKRQGFEATQKRTDDLSTLHIKYPEQLGITPTLVSGVYEIDLNNLKYKYLFFLRGEVDIKLNDACTKTVPLKFVQSDDLSEALKDPFNKPSLDYIIYNIGRNSTGDNAALYIYPGNFEIVSVYPEYIKYPQRINYGNYTYIDGSVIGPSNCELPEQTHSEIVDIATQLASLSVQSPEYIALRNQKITIQE